MKYPDAPDLVYMSFYVEGMHTERLALISLLEERVEAATDVAVSAALTEIIDTITSDGW
jgi:hypothetical protein